MSRHSTFDGWKTTDPADEWLGPEPYDEVMEEKPCDFETFSGECLTCGARVGEPCELGWEA